MCMLSSQRALRPLCGCGCGSPSCRTSWLTAASRRPLCASLLSYQPSQSLSSACCPSSSSSSSPLDGLSAPARVAEGQRGSLQSCRAANPRRQKQVSAAAASPTWRLLRGVRRGVVVKSKHVPCHQTAQVGWQPGEAGSAGNLAVSLWARRWQAFARQPHCEKSWAKGARSSSSATAWPHTEGYGAVVSCWRLCRLRATASSCSRHTPLTRNAPPSTLQPHPPGPRCRAGAVGGGAAAAARSPPPTARNAARRAASCLC